MHPEIRQAGPGSCPICGMALEPEAGGADDGGELADMTRRFWISLALALPVVVIEMGGHFGLGAFARRHFELDRSFVLATPVVLWGGWPFFVRGAQSLRTRHLNMFTLIAMGTGVAYGYSVVAALRAGSVSRGVPRRAWRHRALFRSRRRHHRAGAARPGAGTARPRLDLRRDPRADRARAENRAARQATTAATRTCRSMRSSPATGCAFGPAKKCRSTAWSSRADPRSMNRWSPAKSMPVDEGARRQGHRRHAQPQRRLRHARRKSRPRHHAGAHRRHGRARRSARARRSRGSPTRSPAGSCRRSSPWRSSPSPPGRCSDRSRALPMRSSPPSPC